MGAVSLPSFSGSGRDYLLFRLHVGGHLLRQRALGDYAFRLCWRRYLVCDVVGADLWSAILDALEDFEFEVRVRKVKVPKNTETKKVIIT